jgi:hypothetical protein
MRIVQSALFIIICSCASCVMEVETATLHNLGLAPSIIGAKNACHSQQLTPTQSDLFEVADARIVTILPQVGNTTSDMSNASLLWSYSASFPKQARFSIRHDPRCPAGEIRYFSPSAPSFSGVLSYRYGNATETIALSALGPNPAPINLSAGKLSDADLSSLHANLAVFLNASITVAYNYQKAYYSYGCGGMGDGYVGCGCERKLEAGVQRFQTSKSHERNFSVETGQAYAVWLNPPLASRLDGGGKGKVAFFARRMPALISFSFSGADLGSVQPYLFSTRIGDCGEKIVERRFLPNGSEIFLNASEPLFPLQLVEKNASYVPFYAEFAWSSIAGKAAFGIDFEDAFMHKQAFARNFSVRRPVVFFGPGIKGAQAIPGALQREGATDSAAAAVFPSQQGSAPFPDFSSLAAAFAAPACICAYAICRRLEWL